METVLSKQKAISPEQRARMLDRLETLTELPNTDNVDRAIYDVWHLRGDVAEEAWDEIIRSVLFLEPGQAEELALMYEDQWSANLAAEGNASTLRGLHKPDTEEGAEAITETSDGEVKPTSNALPAIKKSAHGQSPITGMIPFGSPRKTRRSREKRVDVNSRPLSPQDLSVLQACVEVIDRGFHTFIEVGRAIAIIMDRELYRGTHASFKQFADEVLDMTPRRAYQLRDGTQVFENLSQMNNCSAFSNTPLPTNESQVRLLAKYQPSVQREIWLECVQAAGAERVTAKKVECAIEQRNARVPQIASEHGGSIPKDDDCVKKVVATLNRLLHGRVGTDRKVLFDAIQNWLRAMNQPGSDGVTNSV